MTIEQYYLTRYLPTILVANCLLFLPAGCSNDRGGTREPVAGSERAITTHERSKAPSETTDEHPVATKSSVTSDCASSMLKLISAEYGEGGMKVGQAQGPLRWNEPFNDSKGTPGLRHQIAYLMSYGWDEEHRQNEPGVDLLIGECTDGEPSVLVDKNADSATRLADLHRVQVSKTDTCTDQALALIKREYSEGGLRLGKVNGPFMWNLAFFDGQGNPGISHRIAFGVSYSWDEEFRDNEPGTVVLLAECIEGEPSKLRDRNRDKVVDLDDFIKVDMPPAKAERPGQ